MNDDLATRRLIQLGALFLLGAGLVSVINPRRRSLLWYCGPQLVKAVTEEISDHPRTARVLYLAEAAVGLALLGQQARED